MSDDVKLQIVLAAQNASRAAFAEVRRDMQGFSQGVNELRSTIGALVGAGGALVALRQAFQMALDGAAVAKQEEAFKNLTASIGAVSARLLAELTAVSRGVVSQAELIRAAGTAMMMGLNPRELTEMMKIAVATSRQTGQSVTEAFDDITRGVARQSKMILDNLGIIVEVEKANERYAQQLGKTAEALSDAEKRQAFMNEVLAKGGELVRRIGESGGQLTGINQLVAAQSNLWAEVSRSLAQLIDRDMPAYVKAIEWVTGKVRGLREAAGGAQAASELKDLWKEIEMLRSLEAKNMAPTGSAARKEQEYWQRYLATLRDVASEEKKILGSRQSRQWDATSWRQREGQWPDLTDDEKKKILDQRNEWLKKSHQEQLDAAKQFADAFRKTTLSAYDYDLNQLDEQRDKYQQHLQDRSAVDEWYRRSRQALDEKYTVQSEYKRRASQAAYLEELETQFDALNAVLAQSRGSSQDYQIGWIQQAITDVDTLSAKIAALKDVLMPSEAFLADQKAADAFKAQWADYRQRPYQESEAVLADQAAWEQWQEEIKRSFLSLTQLSERTADAIEQNFSNLFFDVWTGKLESAADYFQAFCDSIGRMFSDLMGQLLKQALIGSGPGASGGVGGLLGWLFESFGNTGPEQLSGPKHSGGLALPGAGLQRALPAGEAGQRRLAPDEFAAILQRGEMVIPAAVVRAGPEEVLRWLGRSAMQPPEAKQMHYEVRWPRLHDGLAPIDYPSGSARPAPPEGAPERVHVTVNNYSGQPARVQETRGPDNARQVMVTIGNDIAGGGPIGRSIERTYGLRRMGRKN